MAQIKPSMKSFGQALTGQKLKSTFIKPSAFTSSTAVMSAPGMSSPGAFSAVEIGELSSIKKNLNSLLAIEKKYTDLLGDKILHFTRNEERSKLKKRESSQEGKEKKEKKSKDNPILKGAMKGLDGLINFFGDLFKWFIGYKIVEWVSKPENTKKVQDFVKLFLGIFKFVSNVVGFGIDKLMSGLSHLVDGGGITRVFGALEMIVGFFTLKWLLNPTKIISDIKMIGTLFTKVIPNTINGILNFFTNLIPTAATQAADAAITEGIKGATDAGKEAAKTGAKQVTEQAAKTGGKAATETAAKGAGKVAAKGAAKGAGKSLLKKLPVIGAVAGGAFAVDRASKGDWVGAGMEAASGAAALIPGWGTAASLGIDAALIARDIAKEKDKENDKLPKLAKGGIVTKPTKAIVGEAGPEAILPLDKLSSFTGKAFEGDIGKIIPKFMKMLTIPFTLVGAGIVALMSSSLSVIPGIGPLLVPLVGSIASTFGIPTSMVKGISKFTKAPGKVLTEGASNIAKLFGSRDPKVTKSKGSKFAPSRDTSVRGLLANILGALSSKNSGQPSTTPAPAPSSDPGSPAAPSTPSPSGAAPKVGGSTKSLPQNASLAKAGNATVQNLAGTESDLLSKGYKLVPNTANRFWQDSEGRLYEATRTRNNTSLASMAGVGQEVYKLKAVTEDQINKGFTSVGDSRSINRSGDRERDKSIFRIINQGGILQKEIVNTITQMQNEKGEWVDKKIGGGKIRGYGSGDKIPALLEPQEYVLNRNAVRGLGGAAELDKINFGMFPRFQGGGSVLSKLGDGSKLASAPRGYCVTGVLDTMQKNGVPNPAGTSNDPNNPRGLAAQLIKSYGWGSISGLGSPISLKSAYGNVGANAMSFSEWKKAVKENKIASGSLIFTTRNSDWTGNQSSGHDAAIAKQGGRKLWSGHWQAQVDGVGAVYGSASNKIIALTPGGEQVAYNGSNSSDDGASGETAAAEPEVSWAEIAKDLGKLYKGLTGTKESVPAAPTLTSPAASSPSVPASSTKLQQAQKTSSATKAAQRAAAQAPPAKPNVVTMSQGNNVINQSTTETLAPALGNTLPPTPLTIFPATP